MNDKDFLKLAVEQAKKSVEEGGFPSGAGTGNNVMVNNATVTKTDIQASNGVIHVIDTVLIPN